MVLYTSRWKVLWCFLSAVFSRWTAAGKATERRKLLPNLSVFCERLLRGMIWVMSGCLELSAVSNDSKSSSKQKECVNHYGHSRPDGVGGAALKVTVSRLSHCSMSHHYETFVKTAHCQHAMAEYRILFHSDRKKAEIYNSLHLGSLKNVPHCPKNWDKTTDIKPICCKSKKDNTTK